jgi:hypothetical protein
VIREAVHNQLTACNSPIPSSRASQPRDVSGSECCSVCAGSAVEKACAPRLRGRFRRALSRNIVRRPSVVQSALLAARDEKEGDGLSAACDSPGHVSPKAPSRQLGL